MRRERISKDDRVNLYMSIERYLSPFRRRNYSYTIATHSNTLATIRLTVMGRNGEGSMTIVVSQDKDGTWTVTTMGYRYYLTTLTQLTSVSRTIIRRLLTLVNKF